MTFRTASRDRIEAAIGEQALILPTLPFVALYPSSEFSAFTTPNEFGAFIFASTGTLLLILELIEAFTDQSVLNGESLRDESDCGVQVRDAAFRYFVQEKLVLRQAPDRTSPWVRFLSSFMSSHESHDDMFRALVTGCTDFMLAHEHAHLVHGHVVPGTRFRPKLRDEDALRHEHEADQLAAKIVVTACNTKENFKLLGCAAGLIYFAIHQFVEEVRNNIGLISEDRDQKHPATHERWTRLFRYYDSVLSRRFSLNWSSRYR
jgi:hypothetical protein